MDIEKKKKTLQTEKEQITCQKNLKTNEVSCVNCIENEKHVIVC